LKILHTIGGNMDLICAGISDIGRKRETNQDAIYLSNSSQFYVVADGMGGHSGGDLASTMAIKYLSEFIKKETNEDDFKADKVIRDGIRYANDKIKAFADTDKALHGMGTTVVSVLYQEGKLAIGNVGDSRAYLISNNQIFQITRDHSLVQEKLNVGIYDRQEAADDPHKNILSRTVGFDEEIEIDVFSYDAKPGDIFLLSSDGLHGKVSDEDILYIIEKTLLGKDMSFTSVRDCVQTLVRQANENGGQDNISVIIGVVQ
jgi:serine/threonine protein phosphatase PrpC